MLQSHNRVYFGFFVVIFVAIAVAIIASKTQNPPKKETITTFEQCVAAGMPVMESYPRQCNLPGGKFFVEKIVQAECLVDKDCPSGLACADGKCQLLKTK